MSRRLTVWTATYAAASTLALVMAIITSMKYKEECRRLEANQQVLINPKTTVEFRTMDDGKAVAQVQALNLRMSELKTANDSLLRLTHTLGISNRRLMALAQSTTSASADINVPLRDSISMQPSASDSVITVTDTLRCISFDDPWISLSGCIRADTFAGSIRCRDTLDLVAHKIPRRFLFFRFGCKAIRLDVVSHNPHSTITHARYIRITN